jgi:hypothetical protein
MQTKQESRQLQHRHKTSSIFPAYTFRRINETISDKERVHNFPFGPIEISDRKWTTTQSGCRKSALNVNLCLLRFPPQSTSKCRFLPPRSSRWSRSCTGLSSRWAMSATLSSVMWVTDRWHTGTQSICRKHNVKTRSHIVSLRPIIEQADTGTWAEFWKCRMWTTSRT